MSETDCQEILAQIELYLDHELEEVRCVEIQEHLELCGPCTDRAEFRRSLKVLISKKCRCEDVPEGLMSRVFAVLDEPGNAAPPPGA
ncbi:MAG: mycothiol system anti-sigma-R factor [Actinomycetota bacterium]